MKLFAFGFGFTALRLVDIYADEFERISGTVRHAEKRDELHRQKLDAYLFDAVEHSEIASRIKEADVLLVSVPPGRSEDPVLSAFGQQIENEPARRVGQDPEKGVAITGLHLRPPDRPAGPELGVGRRRSHNPVPSHASLNDRCPRIHRE